MAEENQTGLMDLMRELPLEKLGKTPKQKELGGLLGALGKTRSPTEEEFKFLEDLIVTTDKSQSTPIIIRIGEKFNIMMPGQDRMLSFDSEQEALDYMKKLMPFKKGGRVGYADGTIPKDLTLEQAIEIFKLSKDRDPVDMDEVFSFFKNRKLSASGGRAGYQTGGITETRSLPPEFIEAAQKTYLTDLSRQAGIPSITTATTQQPGETTQQFAQRQAQAQQFGIRRAGMAELAPQVAAQDPLQAAAYQQAVDPTKGLGAFQPFLTEAQTAATGATSLTGPMTTAQTTAYMSPYQQQVIDTTLSEFDRQKQIQQNQLAAQTLGVPGAFGGGREGVQRAEYDAASDRNRAALQSNLLQQGFQQASAARQQDLANRMGLANLQSGLGGAAQDFARAQISGLGALGSQQQAQTQAVLDAQRQAAQMAVDDPRQRLAMFGQGITGLTPGAGTVQLAETPAEAAAGASPLMTALGLGLAGADVYGRIFGPRSG
jgi:hypothetical protein